MKYLYFWTLAFESSQCVFSITICSNLCVPLCVCQLESICKFSCRRHSATHHTHTPSLWLSAGVYRAAVIVGRDDFVQCVEQLSSMCVGFWAASDTFLSDFSGSVNFTGLVKCFTLQKPYQCYIYSAIQRHWVSFYSARIYFRSKVTVETFPQKVFTKLWCSTTALKEKSVKNMTQCTMLKWRCHSHP